MRAIETDATMFQSTPLREGRLFFDAKHGSTIEFQSTPLREGRRMRTTLARGDQVSIHAPARGATGIPRLFVFSTCTFQSTPLREGRQDGVPRVEIVITFQST